MKRPHKKLGITEGITNTKEQQLRQAIWHEEGDTLDKELADEPYGRMTSYISTQSKELLISLASVLQGRNNRWATELEEITYPEKKMDLWTHVVDSVHNPEAGAIAVDYLTKNMVGV